MVCLSFISSSTSILGTDEVYKVWCTTWSGRRGAHYNWSRARRKPIHKNVIWQLYSHKCDGCRSIVFSEFLLYYLGVSHQQHDIQVSKSILSLLGVSAVKRESHECGPNEDFIKGAFACIPSMQNRHVIILKN